jgi:hypothetical protein
MKHGPYADGFLDTAYTRCERYGPLELPEVAVAKFCIEMWRWSRSHAQWSQHYESVTGQWEWYFW